MLQAFDNFRAPLPPKAKPAAPPALPTVLPALLSESQTRVVVVVAVVVAAAPPPMPPPVRVHPLAVVPRQALVAMCHQNPCLMGRQPAGSQDRKQPGQRSVLAPRVPARGNRFVLRDTLQTWHARPNQQDMRFRVFAIDKVEGVAMCSMSIGYRLLFLVKLPCTHLLVMILQGIPWGCSLQMP